MPPSAIVTPGSPNVPATAVCPRCGNTVYNDHLSLGEPVVGIAGQVVYTKLTIDCETCGAISHRRFAGR